MTPDQLIPMYDQYLQLLDKVGVEAQRRWITHFHLLEEAVHGEPLRRLSPAELRAWWLEQGFTRKQLFEMAGAIESVLT